MTALRQYVFERAGYCCEYCLMPQHIKSVLFHLEHVVSVKHGGEMEADNLCMSCPRCNYYKGSDVASFDPLDGAITLLYHPRKQLWRDHFQLTQHYIEGMTSHGRVTVTLLRLNAQERLSERELLLRFGLYPCYKDNHP